MSSIRGSPRSQSSSSAPALSAPPTRRPSALKTKQILETVKARESVARRASCMSAEEMDSLYSSVSSSLRQELNAKREEVDKMQNRSDEIDNAFNELRVRNKEELIKTERRLSRLQIEVKTLESGQMLFGEEESNTKESPVQSRRASTLSTRLLNIHSKESSSPSKTLERIDDCGSEEEDESDEESPPPPPPTRKLFSEVQKIIGEDEEKDKEIDILQNSIFRNLKNNFDAAVPVSESATIFDHVDTSNSSQNVDCTIENIDNVASSCEVGGTPGSATEEVIAGILDEEECRVVTHQRVFDESYSRHYFVDIRTGKSQWMAPSEGVLLCIDPKSNRKFYKNLRTGKTSWKLKEMK